MENTMMKRRLNTWMWIGAAVALAGAASPASADDPPLTVWLPLAANRKIRMVTVPGFSGTSVMRTWSGSGVKMDHCT